jgi:hypothetical protein
MKASSKYGSAYPQTAPDKKVAVQHRRKVASVAAPTPTTAPNVLKLPHERDTAIDQGGGAMPSEKVEQAGRDVKRGLADTDRGAEMHRTYQKQKA